MQNVSSIPDFIALVELVPSSLYMTALLIFLVVFSVNRIPSYHINSNLEKLGEPLRTRARDTLHFVVVCRAVLKTVPCAIVVLLMVMSVLWKVAPDYASNKADTLIEKETNGSNENPYVFGYIAREPQRVLKMPDHEIIVVMSMPEKVVDGFYMKAVAMEYIVQSIMWPPEIFADLGNTLLLCTIVLGIAVLFADYLPHLTYQNIMNNPPQHHPSLLSTPWNVLKSATAAVPATRYALAITGIAAAVAIAVELIGTSDPTSMKSTFIAVAAMVILMVFMVVFAALARTAPGALRVPAMFLTWAMVILLVSSSFLTGSCVFFCWPKCFPDLSSEIFGIPGRAAAPPLSSPATSGTTEEAGARFREVVVKMGSE